MGQLAIVNAPSSFTLIWSMIKPWLSKETAEKVDIFGSDYKDQLLKLIDADCLPSTLGGTCECKEEGGCQLSGAGPWLDGRVGWGPNAITNEKRLLNGLDNQGAINGSASEVEAREYLRGIVPPHNDSALVEPMANGKIHELEMDHGADERKPGAPIDSSDIAY
jgi:hypothetical protein